MDPGKLNRLVVIKRPATGIDTLGQPLSGRLDLATVWASIVRKSGAETIRADQDVSKVQASIRIRMRADVDATMEVHHAGTVYEIKAVLPDEKTREWLDLVCEVVHG